MTVADDVSVAPLLLTLSVRVLTNSAAEPNRHASATRDDLPTYTCAKCTETHKWESLIVEQKVLWVDQVDFT